MGTNVGLDCITTPERDADAAVEARGWSAELGDRESALGVLRQLLDPTVSQHVRLAAARALITAAPMSGDEDVLTTEFRNMVELLRGS